MAVSNILVLFDCWWWLCLSAYRIHAHGLRRKDIGNLLLKHTAFSAQLRFSIFFHFFGNIAELRRSSRCCIGLWEAGHMAASFPFANCDEDHFRRSSICSRTVSMECSARRPWEKSCQTQSGEIHVPHGDSVTLRGSGLAPCNLFRPQTCAYLKQNDDRFWNNKMNTSSFVAIHR